jgi:hypothetical protein
MRSVIVIFILGIWGFVIGGCEEGGGGGSGFTPTGRIVAVAERSDSNTVQVGGPKGSATPGSTVEITDLDTGEVKTTTVGDDGSFVEGFRASTEDTFRVIVEEDGIDETIGVSIIRDAVERSISRLGSVPTAIEIRGSRAYVLNGFSDNIQIFDLTTNPPEQIGTIVLPVGSDPIAIAFLDDTRAYVANLIGQSVALVNVVTLQCETIIARTGGDFRPCQNVFLAAGAFEDPSGVAVSNGKVYVTNGNLDSFFEPQGNGFITVISVETNQVVRRIDSTGQGTGGITATNGRLYVVNSGDPDFDSATGEFFCDPNSVQSIDIIDPRFDSVVGSIPIPLSDNNPFACNPNRLKPTPDGRFGYLGSGLTGVLFKVDLQNNTLIRGADNPIVVTSTDGLDATFDVEVRDDGLAFIALFNSDRIAVMDTSDDSLNPFPFIAPFPAGLRADNPDSDFFDGIQDLAIRENGGFPDLFFITGISEQLGSIDTSLLLPPE